MNNGIRCITFDVDDTLWACEPVIRRAEAALYTWLTAHYPRIPATYSLEDMRAQRKALLAERADLRHDMTALRRQWITRLADEMGYRRDMVEPAVAYFRHQRNQVQLFEAAAPLLERLREDYTVGVITNGNAQLDRIGVEHLFDFVMYSAEIGVPKPAPGIFEAALRRAGVRPEQTIHVGDDPERDILGAAGVGMGTIWYNPSGVDWPLPGGAPDAEIGALAELEDVLCGW